MKKNILFLMIALAFSAATTAQNGYDIKINLKGGKDTMVYLAKYVFDQTYIVDTCKKIKNGSIQFKGKTDLEKGIYILVSQDKVPYFEFIVNQSQKFTISANHSDLVSTLNAGGDKENDLFFTYMKYGTEKNKEFNSSRELTKGKNKEDSARFMNEKIVQLNADVKKFDVDFMEQVKGTYLYDHLNLRTEKNAKDIPKAKNGRPDSVYAYYYYKSHYFDGINFKDERILKSPYFDDRIKNYFDNVILMHPDTVIQEIDKVLAKCDEGNQIYLALIGHFTYKYEQSKLVSFDKVFVHMADNYIATGKSKEIYSAETRKVIKERVDIMRNLLVGKKVSDLFLIDTVDGKQVRKMGFDTATSVESITNLYYKNQAKLTPLFKTLYQVNAKYTVLIFWAADCGHCQKEVPKLHEDLKELKGKSDVKVFAVQTKDDLFDSWRKFIVENKLGDFMHVYDPVHINGYKDKFDVNSTPVIYILDKDKNVLVKKISADQVVNVIKHLESTEKKP